MLRGDCYDTFLKLAFYIKNVYWKCIMSLSYYCHTSVGNIIVENSFYII